MSHENAKQITASASPLSSHAMPCAFST